MSLPNVSCPAALAKSESGRSPGPAVFRVTETFLYVHTLLAYQPWLTELGGVLHHQQNRHLVRHACVWHVALCKVTCRCHCVQGWDFHHAWKCYLTSGAELCLRACVPGAQAVHIQCRVWAIANGFAQDLSMTPRLWENVDATWQVANKIYMVQNMPELSK